MMQKILNGYKDYVVGNGILNLDKISFSAICRPSSSSSCWPAP